MSTPAELKVYKAARKVCLPHGGPDGEKTRRAAISELSAALNEVDRELVDRLLKD